MMPIRLSLRLTAVLALAAAGSSAETFALLHTATLYKDAKEEKLLAPEGVACTDAGDVVIADSGNGRLLISRLRDGAFSAVTTVKVQQLGYPVRVQIDSKGDVLSLDRKSRRIARVGLGGDFKGYVEISGQPEGRYFPVAFKLDKADALYVLDAGSARVLVADAAGKFQRALPLPKGKFVDVAVGPQGTIYVVDAVGGAIWGAEKSAKAFAEFAPKLRDFASFPTYLAIDSRGFFLLVDSHGNGLLILGPDGSFVGRQLGLGWNDGFLYYPEQLCVTAKGDTVIADRNNNRVQAFAAAQ